MKDLLLLILSILIGFHSFSQNENLLDSSDDINKINKLNLLGKKYLRSKKIYLSIEKSLEALKLSQKLQNHKGMFYAYIDLAQAKCELEEYQKSLDYLDNASKYSNEIDDDKSKAIIFQLYGICFEAQDKYEEAMIMSIKALKLHEKTNNLREIASLYNNIGIIHSNQSNSRKALFYYKKAINIRRKIGDKRNSIATYNNIGIIYIDLNQLDSAISVYHTGIKLCTKMNFEKGFPLLYNNLGLCYLKKNNLDSAVFYHLKSLHISESTTYKKGIGLALLNIGKDYYTLKKYSLSLNYLNQSLDFNTKNNFLFTQQGTCRALAELYEKIEKFKKSSYYYKLSADLNDSIYNLKFMENINELNQKYETEKKDKELLKLQTERKVKQLEVDREKSEKKYLIIVLFAACILIMALFIFSLIVKKTSNKLKLTNQIISNRNSEILKSKDKINQQAIQIAKYQSQMNPHFIFNAINGLQGMILKGDRLIAVDHLHRFTKLLRLTLNNSEGDYLSLTDEIEYLYKYVEFELYKFSNKYNFSITVSEDIDLNYKIPTMLIQPMIENAIKHAGLSTLENGMLKVKIELVTIDKIPYFQINIIDNGNGFSTNEKEHISKGISITKHRIYLELTKNNCEIENYFYITSPFNPTGRNIGTKITMLVPFNNNLNEKLI